MTDTPQVLLQHHLKKLRLPTFQSEYAKLARQCANLADKLKIKMQIRALEDKHDESWKAYDSAKKEINKKKLDNITNLNFWFDLLRSFLL